MKVRGIALALVAFVLAAAMVQMAAEAQPPRSLAKIAILALLPNPGPKPRPMIQAALDGLGDLGWIEGKTALFDIRSADGRTERLPALARELISKRPDVVLTIGTPATIATMEATATIPIVMTAVADPIASGIVPSLAKPGGNVTGVSTNDAEVTEKLLSLLKEAAPRITRVAVWRDPTSSIHVRAVKQSEVGAKRLGLTLYAVDVRTPADLESAFDATVRRRSDAVVLYPVLGAGPHLQIISDFAVKKRLPTASGLRGYVEAGQLLSYGADYLAHARRAAAYIDKVLRGARPAELPVEQPTKYELAVNLRTAKALGLTIPLSLLQRADQVIE